MPVAPNIMRVRRPDASPGVGGQYTAVSGDSTSTASAGTLYAYRYNGGSYVEQLASVVLSPDPFDTFETHNIVRTINRIHSDSAGLVPDGALAFAYRSGATTWQIAVWDVEDTGLLTLLEWTSTTGISGPVYSDGWLWYFKADLPSLQLRRVRCDLTGDELVRSEAIGSTSPYVADGNLAYMMLCGNEAASTFDSAPVDTPIFQRDGSAADLTPGRGFAAGGHAGLPLADGRSVGINLGTSRAFALNEAPGGIDHLWPSGWAATLGIALGGSFEGGACISLPPSRDELVAYPMEVVGTYDPSGGQNPRQIVRTVIGTTYADEDPIPHATVETPPTGFKPFAMLARS